MEQTWLHGLVLRGLIGLGRSRVGIVPNKRVRSSLKFLDPFYMRHLAIPSVKYTSLVYREGAIASEGTQKKKAMCMEE